MITRDAARNLAVDYAALTKAVEVPIEARTLADHNAIAVWGRSLIESQRATGIYLQREETLLSLVAFARIDADALSIAA